MLTRCAFVALLMLLPLTSVLADDVPYKSLDVRYNPDERTIQGHVDVTVPSPTETVYFALLPNAAREPNPFVSKRMLDSSYPFGFEPARLDVESVKLVESQGETPLPYRLLSLPPTLQTYGLDETVLAVDLTSTDDRPTIRIRFTTQAPRTSAGDDGVTDEILTWRFGWYPLLLDDQEGITEEGGAIGCGERGSFPFVLPWTELDATIHAPEDLVLICGADRVDVIETSEDPDGLSQYYAHFTSPTRSLGITLGADYERYLLDGPQPIEVAYRRGHEEEARLFATYARDILTHYEERFGAYPRARMTIVENPNSGGSAFAADGIVWLSSLFFTHRGIPLSGIMNRFLEYVLAHEIAHQWLGLGSGVDLDTDAWLSEGLAQYASISYFEERHGSFEGNVFEIAGAGILEDLIDRQFGFYNLREHQTELPYLLTLWNGFDEALVKPTRDVEFANASVARLYDKGYLVARSIAATVGEETMDRALRAAFETTRAGRLDALDLQRLLEREAGRSLDDLFSAWVFGDVTVDYAAKIAARRRTETDYETTVVVRREGGIPQPVNVEVTLTSGATLRKTWDGAETEATIVFHTPSRVSRVTIDPEHRLLDSDRLNNNDPIKVVSAVNRAALPLDAYLISPDASSGGFTFSRLDRFRVTVQETSASMIVNEGRHHQYSGTVSIEDGKLTGNLAYTYTSYHHPETGSPATYWEADVAVTAGVRRIVSGEDAVWTLHLSALDLPSFARSHAKLIALDVAENAASRLSISMFDEIRLLPGFYLQGVGSLGFSVGDLPIALRFTFDELRASSMNPETNKLTGMISVDLATEEQPYNVMNLAMVDGRRTRLFLAGGLGWTTLNDFGKTTPCVEAGIEQVLDLSTLGGLLPLTVRVGIATPVMGPGKTVIYAGLSL
jgi:hypothetical protein